MVADEEEKEEKEEEEVEQRNDDRRMDVKKKENADRRKRPCQRQSRCSLGSFRIFCWTAFELVTKFLLNTALSEEKGSVCDFQNLRCIRVDGLIY